MQSLRHHHNNCYVQCAVNCILSLLSKIARLLLFDEKSYECQKYENLANETFSILYIHYTPYVASQLNLLRPNQ